METDPVVIQAQDPDWIELSRVGKVCTIPNTSELINSHFLLIHTNIYKFYIQKMNFHYLATFFLAGSGSPLTVLGLCPLEPVEAVEDGVVAPVLRRPIQDLLKNKDKQWTINNIRQSKSRPWRTELWHPCYVDLNRAYLKKRTNSGQLTTLGSYRQFWDSVIWSLQRPWRTELWHPCYVDLNRAYLENKDKQWTINNIRQLSTVLGLCHLERVEAVEDGVVARVLGGPEQS